MEHSRGRRQHKGVPVRPRLQDAEIVTRSKRGETRYEVVQDGQVLGSISYGLTHGFTFRIGGIDVCHGHNRGAILSQVEALGARRRAA